MILRDRLEQQGQVLFRWRSYTPLIPLAAALLFVTSASREHNLRGSGHLLLVDAGCLLVGLFGLAIRVFTVGYAPRGSSGRTTVVPRASILNSSGPYSVVRHPLYLGNLLMWLAVGLFSRSWLLTLLIAALFWLQYERIILAEELFLRERFGAAFEEWAACTPVFLPDLRLWRSPVTQFSWPAAITRESSSLLALMATLTLLDGARTLGRTGHFAIGVHWLALLAAAALLNGAASLRRLLHARTAGK